MNGQHGKDIDDLYEENKEIIIRLARVEERLSQQEKELEAYRSMVIAIDTKMDKMSFALSKIQATLDFIVPQLRSQIETQNSLTKSTLDTATKTKILWGIIATIGTALVLTLLKTFVG